jgi:flagellar biosynthesis protein FlhF
MKQLSFMGRTQQEALQKALQNCGEDAPVIDIKKISNNGIEMFEVIVRADNISSNNRLNSSYQVPAKPKKTVPSENYIKPNSYNSYLEQARLKQSTQTNNSSEEYIEDTKLPPIKRSVSALSQRDSTTSSDDMEFLKKEILKLSSTVSGMQKTIWENSKKSSLDDLIIPPEFEDIYDIFIKNELKDEMSYKILKKAIEKIPLHLRLDINKTKELFKNLLNKIVLVKEESTILANQRKIMMLVGPTGVGKTTTIAKLAARYLYKMDTKYKVGVISLDLFRVGAVEQLNSYAKIMRLPIESAKNSNEFKAALQKLSYCNYILVDTAGASQYDVEKIELINDYLQSNLDISIERVLVMPMNIKNSDLDEIYSKFSKLFIHSIIFSKLDETSSFGSLISFANSIKKPISYLSIGQNVPDDLIVAKKDFIIDCFMNMNLRKN